MIQIPETQLTVGSSPNQRRDVALRDGVHVSMLADELPSQQTAVPAFQIDASLVTNAQYASFLAATGHEPPAMWKQSGTRDRADAAAASPVCVRFRRMKEKRWLP